MKELFQSSHKISAPLRFIFDTILNILTGSLPKLINFSYSFSAERKCGSALETKFWTSLHDLRASSERVVWWSINHKVFVLLLQRLLGVESIEWWRRAWSSVRTLWRWVRAPRVPAVLTTPAVLSPTAKRTTGNWSWWPGLIVGTFIRYMNPLKYYNHLDNLLC